VNVRIHLRHTGQRRWRIGAQAMSYGWGYNFYLGRWFIAVRRPSVYNRAGFFDLGFGRVQMKYRGVDWE